MNNYKENPNYWVSKSYYVDGDSGELLHYLTKQELLKNYQIIKKSKNYDKERRTVIIENECRRLPRQTELW